MCKELLFVQLLSDVFRANYLAVLGTLEIDCGMLCLSDLEIWLTTDVTDRQGMYIPHRNLIPLWYTQGPVFIHPSALYFL
jgi:hypothetical protein